VVYTYMHVLSNLMLSTDSAPLPTVAASGSLDWIGLRRAAPLLETGRYWRLP